MRRTILASLLVVVPSIAFALDYTDVSSQYTDAPFSKAETAGISVLTNLGAVSGNPDGSFAPARNLNRAEFLKMVYLARGTISVIDSDAGNCFPDVQEDDWFSKYVCLAKLRGDIAGYPDGLFRPGNTVNYVEALKMIDNIFGFSASFASNDPWYAKYIEAGREAGILLTEDIAPDTTLTRGQAARLIAASAAVYDDELEHYRAFERGEVITSSSSSDESSSSSSSSASSTAVSSDSSSSSARSSSSSASSVAYTFPSISHFAVADTTTDVLYDGTVQATEQVTVQSVELELFREIHSLDSLMVIDQSGNRIAELTLQGYNNTTKTKWRADITSDAYVFAGNTPVRVGVLARIKGQNDGGTSNELLEIKTLRILTVGAQSAIAQTLTPAEYTRPSHQTAYGRMTGVKNTLGSSLSVQQGSKRQLASFALTAQSSGGTVRVNNLSFELQMTNASAYNLTMGTSDAAGRADCSFEYQADGKTLITCPLPEALQTMSSAPVTVSIYGDVSLSPAKDSGMVQFLSPGTGALGKAGIVNWTDGATTFNWMEAGYPADSSPLVTVTK